MQTPPEPDHLEIEEGERCPGDAANDANDGTGDDSEDVHVQSGAANVEQDVAIGLEASERAFVGKSGERRIQ